MSYSGGEITKERLQANYDIAAYGLIVGVLVVILFIMLYNYMYPAECFTDPNSLDPATKALLSYHLTRDPVGIISPKFIGGKASPNIRI